MAFSFSNIASGGGGFGAAAQASTAGTQVHDGPELHEIQTDQIGFSAINGDAKVRLLPSPWPAEALPSPTSSLLSIASNRGLVAAAGPDALILAQTSSVRSAFYDKEDSSTPVRTVPPAAQVPVHRLAHVVFSADENVLVTSSQESGGITAYQVAKLMNGQTEPTLQISTNNSGLRALIPNPVPESAELFAAVTSNGELLMADLKSGELRAGQNGPVLKSGVSCLSWSNRGKQLVAGLADGTATQMKPDGTIVAEIPKSTSVPSNMHVSAISWLENDLFFVVYTPNSANDDGMMPSSDYWIISREPKSSNYTFQRLPEVSPPFGMERLPSFHYIARLRKFPPHLQDLLLVASTTSIDVGLVSKADHPLSTDEPVTGAFTYTTIGEDSRKAQLPLSESMGDTSPIGMGLDLSSREEIVNPIPSDSEIQQSATPLPGLLILNHEGVLVFWWVVYNDSIRQKTAYPGLVAAAGTRQAPMKSPTPPNTTPSQVIAPATGGFGQSGFGTSVPFAEPAAPVSTAPAVSSGFGGASTPAFGAVSTLGGAKPSWTSTGFGNTSTPQAGGSGSGQPVFGSATSVRGNNSTTAFGAPNVLGSRPSPFGGAAISAVGGGSATSPFGAMGDASKRSGFSSFANTNGTSGFGAAKVESANAFGKASNSDAFSQLATSSPFGSNPDSGSAFGAAKPLAANGNGVAGINNGFKLESSFKGDGSAKDDLPKPTSSSGFGFGGGFADSLGETKKVLSPTHDREAEMEGRSDGRNDSDVSVLDDRPDSSQDGPPQSDSIVRPFITPPSTINQSKATPAPPLSGLFGMSNQTQTTTPQAAPATTSGFSFGGFPSTTPKDTPAPAHMSFFGKQTQTSTTPTSIKASVAQSFSGRVPGQHGEEETTEAPTETAEPQQNTIHIKTEPPSDDDAADLRNVPEAPLPPDPTSKASYTPGGTSASSDRSRPLSDDDAPLPPDFIPARTGAHDDARGDPGDDEDFSSDFDGSGEDVTQNISPIEDPSAEQTEQIQTSPESSFGRAGHKSSENSPTGGIFTKVTAVDLSQKSSRALFGEVGSGPIFPHPKPQESPRSPSPVRHLLPSELLRPEAGRSVSAPARPPSIIEKRRAQLGQSGLASQAFPARDLSFTKAKARTDALADAKIRAEAEAAQELEDDEDERLRQELERPVEPSQELDSFMPYQQSSSEDTAKTGIPGQIERLYQDINSMIDTLGINARSLSAYMMYQQGQAANDSWPDVLKSETPMDALNDEWVLEDTFRLHEGTAALETELELRKITDIAATLQQCQEILSRDILQLRTRLSSIRKALNAASDADSNPIVPLSAEQSSIQHDLRKASANVQMKLTQAEETLSMLRAKLAESAPPQDKSLSNATRSKLIHSVSQKKPSVEAVTNTIAKMTSMAEKKSSDIDVLEAQLKKMQLLRQDSVSLDGTPLRGMARLALDDGPRTPESSGRSVYHTPDSKFSRSTRSTPGANSTGLRASMNEKGALVSIEDRELWKEKARRKKQVANILKQVLLERQQGKRAG